MRLLDTMRESSEYLEKAGIEDPFEDAELIVLHAAAADRPKRMLRLRPVLNLKDAIGFAAQSLSPGRSGGLPARGNRFSILTFLACCHQVNARPDLSEGSRCLTGSLLLHRIALSGRRTPEDSPMIRPERFAESPVQGDQVCATEAAAVSECGPGGWCCSR